MQSVAFSLSSPSPCSIPSLKPRKFGSNNPRFDPIRVSSYSQRCDLSGSSNVVSVPSLPKRSWSPSYYSSVLPHRAWNSVPSDSKAEDRFQVRATAAESAGEDGENSGGLMKTLELGLLFGLWFFFNIYFNIYNKQVPLLFLSFLDL